MLACILFVFGTLVEYAGILFAAGIECSVDESDQEDEDKKADTRGGSIKSQRATQALPYKW